MEPIPPKDEVKSISRAFKKISPETIARIWKETKNRPETVLLILRYWLEDRIETAPKGTYFRLLDYPGLRVSAFDGGAFTEWGNRRTLPGGIITTAALIFRIPIERFPEAVLKVEEALMLIANGELKTVELSDEEKRAYYRTFKAEFLPYLAGRGLMTTVARKAPTPTKLWRAIPEVHYLLSSPTALLRFFENARIADNRTSFRITVKRYERTYGNGRTRGGKVRILLEETPK
jgi:hypothetical protein